MVPFLATTWLWGSLMGNLGSAAIFNKGEGELVQRRGASQGRWRGESWVSSIRVDSQGDSRTPHACLDKQAHGRVGAGERSRLGETAPEAADDGIADDGGFSWLGSGWADPVSRRQPNDSACYTNIAQ